MGKKQSVITTFSVELTEYGWAVRTGTERLGLFVTLQHALSDVKRRRAALKGAGKASAVEVTGEEPGTPRGRFQYPYKPSR